MKSYFCLQRRSSLVAQPGSRLTTVSFVCRFAIAALIVFAAGGKFLDLSAFRDSLDSWVLVPPFVRNAAAMAVPSVEALVVFAFFQTRLFRFYVAMGLMIILFTSVYLFHAIFVSPPECGCFLKLQIFGDWQTSMWSVLVRNLVLLCIWAIGLIGFRVPTPPSGRSRR